MQRFDTLARLIYVNALFIVGTLGTLIAPALLESGSLSGLYWQRRWSWRQVALVATLEGIVCGVPAGPVSSGRGFNAT